MPISATIASAASCYDLWFERNAIFDDYGYCFQTQLGKQTFDNANCNTSNPRLSASDQRSVNAIKAEKQRRDCRVN